MTDVDPLADPPGPPRDGYGRPLITPVKRDGTPNTKAKPVPYTRASTFCGYPADKSGLATWRVRHAAHGIAISPDLAGMVGALGNPDQLDRRAKADLDAILETAHDRSGGNQKANHGTAVHSLTEPGNAGTVPDRMAADVDAYQAVMDAAGLVVVDTERFTVNDAVKVAGTYDHRVETTRDLTFADGVTIPAGTRMLLDKKTGTLHPDENAIQLATYARGQLCDPDSGEREPLDVSPQWGIVAHIPALRGKATLHRVDLHAGWKGAKLAEQIRDWRSGARKLAVMFAESDAPAPEPVAPAVEPAPVAEVVEVARRSVELPGTLGGDDRLPDVEPAARAEPSQPDTAPHTEPAAPAGVDEFGDPIPDPTLTAADAIANLARAGLNPRDVILVGIDRAEDAQACRALWSKYAREGAWHDKHTEAVKRRLAALQAAA